MAISWRIVVFEDDFLLAETLSEALVRLGFELVHCCSSLQEAMQVVEEADFDLAIVDMDLRGLDASPILDQLVAGNRRALLATAADEEYVPPRFAQLPRLTKPYDQQQLKKTIEKMQASGPTGGA